MKHCQKCKLDFPVSYRFCGSCGGPLPDSLSCQGCGELVESKWAFCTSCGKTLTEGTKGQVFPPDASKVISVAASTAPSPAPSVSKTSISVPLSEQRSTDVSLQEWYAAADLFDEGSDTTVTSSPRQDLVPKAKIASAEVVARPLAGNGKSAPTLTMLSAYGESRESAPAEWQGRHALLVGILLLVFFGVLGFGGWYWWTHRASAAQPQPQVDSSTVSTAGDSAPPSTSASRATKTSERTIANNPADEELKRLREKRIGAKPAEASQIIASLAEAEKKYASDYRFPYERAKLSIKGITSHHEAFGALALAAEKAIDNGKAQEMLDSLMADKDGDFYKLSRGHREWQTLAQALSNKDKKSLSELHH